MPAIDEIFTPNAEVAIRRAVDQAEKTTAGEIVPFVVATSDSYEGALWKGAALGALLISALAAATWLVWEPWGHFVALWIATPPLVGGSIGYLLSGAIPPLRRALIGAEVLELRVRRRASVAFLEEEIFRTQDRTGILIFLSLFERHVVVLGDEGIHRAVEPEAWDGLVNRLTDGLERGKAVEALLAAIGECGDLLRSRGVDVLPGDTDELLDDLRTRET